MSSIRQVQDKYYATGTLGSGKKFTVKKLRMGVGLKVAKKLNKIILPLIGGGIDGLKHDDYIHGAPKSFSTLALLLCEQLDQAQIEDLIVVLLEDFNVDGKDVDIDDYFSANYGELVEVLEFSLKENFKSFFTGKGIQAQLVDKLKEMLGLTQEELLQE